MASTAASTTSIEHSPVTPTKPAVVQLPSSPLGGEASSSTLPAPEAVTSITDEKPTIELSSSIPSEPELTPHAPSSTGDMSLSQSQHADAHDHTQPESLPIDEVPTPVPAPARAKSLSITLLLISGVRYPFTINSEYLSRHNIQVADSDPMQMGVFALKECIWKEWKDEEWNVKPPSANFIRLIHFGRLLDDRQQLKGMCIWGKPIRDIC